MKALKFSSLSTISLFLLACGGSGNETTAPVDNTYPVISVASQIDIAERETVSLEATATDESGIASYQWRQKSGIEVELENPNQANISFNAPSISLTQGVQQLTLEVSATDKNNLTSTSDVVINVSPISRAPLITVASNNLTSKSGAFTTLSWEITESEPIVSVTLTSNNEEFELIAIENNGLAKFNVPTAFVNETETTLTLTVTDEDNNSTTTPINLTISPVEPLFKEPRLIYSQDKEIRWLSEMLGGIVIESIDNNDTIDVQAFYYENNKLTPNNDIDLTTIFPNKVSLFVDFNKDGKVDGLYTGFLENDNCSGLMDAEVGLYAIYQNDTGFAEPEVIHSFGCKSPEEIMDGIPTIRYVRDYNGDGNLDFATHGNIYFYNPQTDNYEVDPRFITLFCEPSCYFTPTYPLDLDLDLAVDIITPVLDKENCNDYMAECTQLAWAQNLSSGNYNDFAIFDEDHGNYTKFNSVDVNQDGTNELVVEFISLGYPGDPWQGLTYTRWYEYSDGTINKFTVEPISNFVDLTGEGNPYFVDIDTDSNSVSLYKYNEVLNRPVKKEVHKLPLEDTLYYEHLLTDIDKDGDLDILVWSKTRLHLVENMSK